MEWHQIEVDHEVFAYLQIRARAFVDSPNDVLRRELAIARSSVGTTQEPRRTNSEMPSATKPAAPPRLPSFGFGVPEALKQTLWVMRLVRQGGRTRPEATSEVARIIQVTPQTVLDKYCRQLDLTAARFDLLLLEPVLSQLQAILYSEYPEHKELIRSFISELIPTS